MGENNKLIAAIAFIAGIAIGANWGKIKPKLEPLFSSLSKHTSCIAEKGAKFIAEQKEKVEDTIAATKIAATKKSLQKRGSEASVSESEDIIVKTKNPLLNQNSI